MFINFTYHAHVKNLCLIKSDCSIRVYQSIVLRTTYSIGLKEAATANVFPVNSHLLIQLQSGESFCGFCSSLLCHECFTMNSPAVF